MMSNGTNDTIQQDVRLQELMAYEEHSRILAHWEPVRYMDSGTFSYIFRVRSRQAGTDAVLKFIPNPKDLLDCHEQGSPEDRFYQMRFAAAKREAEIMGKFRGNAHVVQYLEEPEYLKRSFVNAHGKAVYQYAVLICMPLYKNHQEWFSQIAGDRNARLRLGIEISEALIAFEEKGVYHRDIKPGNILMDDAGHFCLGDVGEAKLESEFTTTGFHGTRPYMAPEVYNQENERKKMHSDHRSDIYSLGIILYKLFNRGQFPFLQESGELTADARTSFTSYSKKYSMEANSEQLTDGERARLLRYDGAKLPPPCEADVQLSRVILKACAYRKEDRYATAEALRHDLLCCIEGGKPIGAKKSGSRKNGLIVGGCVLAAVVAAGSVYVVLRQGGVYKKETVYAATAVPTEAPKTEDINQYAQVIRSNTPVRANSDSDSKIQSLLAQGTEVYLRQSQIAADGEKWYLVQYGDAGYGYVCADTVHLMEQNTPAAVPTNVPSPTPTATPSPTPTATQSPTPTPSPTPTATPSPTPTPMPTPIPSPIFTSLPVVLESAATENYTYDVKMDHTGQKYIAITGYKGKSDAKLMIPANIRNLPVREISDSAFNRHSSFTGALTIPVGVTSIGNYAFYSCRGFAGALTIPNSVTSIGNGAFWYCSGLSGVLTIPDGVMSIGDYAFSGCGGFTGTLTIPDSVMSIGDYAFGGCDGFTGTLTISDSVMSIGNGAFSGCAGFTGALTIPDGVTSIGNYAFEGCRGFTGALTIPDSVTSIGDEAFSGCNFTEIRGKKGTLAESLAKELGVRFVEFHTTVSDATKESTAALTIFESADTENYCYEIKTDQIGQKYIAITGCDNQTDENLIIPASIQGLPVREIAENAFYDGSGRGQLIIPNSVRSIGNWAFWGCCDLTGALTIPDGVTSIGEGAFMGCTGFTGALTLSDSVTSIGDEAFSYCGGLTGNLILPDSVTSIGYSAFYECYGLTGPLTIPDGVTSIGDSAFSGCTGFTGTLTLPDSAKSIGDSVFESCSGLTGELRIPNGVTSIGEFAFWDCSGLTGALTIPDGVTSIGYGAFGNCSGLTGALTIPDSVTSIGDEAFSDCNFTEVRGKKGTLAESIAKELGVRFVEYHQ